ncbi:hypothetical protein K1T71_009010 [Dendrolimus kikuchii]|uniref:Uncharacterized protein n=1 Tax=Dendrolimus kikuchii TaxID=765133 RepID=A0ACC1CW91_9NEOP|nr:hypothetical protein K1T71_009010 [Dendrolimus kikuchii]
MIEWVEGQNAWTQLTHDFLLKYNDNVNFGRIIVKESAVDPLNEAVQSATPQNQSPQPTDDELSPDDDKQGEGPNRLSIYDTPQIRKFKLSAIKAREVIRKQQLQVKRLRETNRRLVKKVAQMENIIKHLIMQSDKTDEPH